MQKNWVKANIVFMNYILSKFEQSVKASLIANKIIVTEVNETKLLKLKTKE